MNEENSFRNEKADNVQFETVKQTSEELLKRSRETPCSDVEGNTEIVELLRQQLERISLVKPLHADPYELELVEQDIEQDIRRRTQGAIKKIKPLQKQTQLESPYKLKHHRPCMDLPASSIMIQTIKERSELEEYEEAELAREQEAKENLQQDNTEIEFSRSELKEFRRAFNALDKDRRGFIKLNEIYDQSHNMEHANVMPDLGDLLKASSIMDPEETDFKGFLHVMQRARGKAARIQQLLDSFRIFDREATGFIDINDVTFVLAHFAEQFPDDLIEAMMTEMLMLKENIAINYELVLSKYMDKSDRESDSGYVDDGYDANSGTSNAEMGSDYSTLQFQELPNDIPEQMQPMQQHCSDHIELDIGDIAGTIEQDGDDDDDDVALIFAKYADNDNESTSSMETLYRPEEGYDNCTSAASESLQ